MKKRLLYVLVGFLLLFVLINGWTTYKHASKATPVALQRLNHGTDRSAAEHLQQAITIATVSFEDSISASPAFDTLLLFLRYNYPDVFGSLNAELFSNHSLLLTWKGTDASLPPVLFYAHMDVVPAEMSHWRFDPFHTPFRADTVYGRGAVDDKAGVIGLFEAIHRSLAKGIRPKHDIYFAFGHDEELDGWQGASVIADSLMHRGIRFSWMLDEGGLVAEHMVPFVDAPVAMVMTAEKGYMNVELQVEGRGGHSSYPPSETPLDILTAAWQRIHQQPFERRVIPALDGFMESTGPYMPFPYNTLFANRWWSSPLIMAQYEKIPEANAMIRTTSACTILQSGVKANVIPSHATAIINLRLLPGDNSASILEALKSIIQDPRVHVRPKGVPLEASENASTDAEGYIKIRNSIHDVFPDAVVAPSLSIASTDSRHFRRIVDNTYRFLPLRMNREILAGMHGTDERIGTREFTEAVLFYESLLARVASGRSDNGSRSASAN